MPGSAIPRPPLAALATLAAAAVLVACGGQDASQMAADRDTFPASQPAEEGAEQPAEASAGASAPPAADGAVLSGTQPLLDGEPADLAAYRGKVVLVVNTATECGFTPQFERLERLYEQRKSEGFVVLGFPADDVAGQEPRDDAEIAEFCEANFGVSFPMFSKSNVVSEPVNPVFAALAEKLGAPSWNFNKYLLDRRGAPVERFDQNTEPDDPELTAAIDAQL